MAKKRVALITMGCSKNLVDSERVLHLFREAGFEVEHNPETLNHDEVIVNTCGFIGDAKEESINTILECTQAKKNGYVKNVTVMGCLSQRYRDELKAEIPEVDNWFGKFDWKDVCQTITGRAPGSALYDRVLTTPRHSAYIKISEGCNRYCAFCAIPLITGRHTSRSIDDIVAEVESLVARGVKEFNIIAQDLSSYGTDLYGRSALAELLDRMSSTKGVEWIRLHYAYPADFPYDILPLMASRHNICKYLDIALQHIADGVLANMRRRISAEQTRNLLNEIRRQVPGIHLRTTLMVGFPGEGSDEFTQLELFVREQKFERMGAFAYSQEDDTFAARNFKDTIPEKEKQRRLDRIMELQQEISLEHNRRKVGKMLRVLIDKEEKDYYVGRTEWDSPDVDPEVLVRKTALLKPGEFAWVNVVSASEFELIAEPLQPAHNSPSN